MTDDSIIFVGGVGQSKLEAVCEHNRRAAQRTLAADDIERYVVARGSEVEASPEKCTALYRAVLARFHAAEGGE